MQKLKRRNSRLLRSSRNRRNRSSHTNRSAHSRIRACGAHANRGPKGKSCKHQRQMKLRIHPIQRRPHVIDFTHTMIVLALAQSGPAKIEAQHGKAKTVQRLHGVKHDLIVQRPAEQRVRMANHRRMRRTLRPCIQQRLKPPRRAVEK